MKKILLAFLIVFVLFPIYAQDFNTDSHEGQVGESRAASAKQSGTEPAIFSEGDFFLSGGVKTGLLVRNRDFGGALNGMVMGEDLSLHFASYENNARNGEGWLNAGYSGHVDKVGKFGLQLGIWAHGDINSFNDALHLGDHFVWANFADDRLRFIGGQGGGAPISSGGWIGAGWLGYTGLRLFWVDPSGFSAGIIFPDPGDEGIKPVNYLSLLGAGLSFKHDNWWISAQFDNSPIYDDSESNYYGGLHRPVEQDPIAQAGNVAVGIGIDNIYGGKGNIVIEAMINNLGEDDETGKGGDYTISKVSSSFALKTGCSFTDSLYAEIKGKYTMKQGDDPELSRAIYWGKLEFEPYLSFQPFNHLVFQIAVYGAVYINSYYLALDNPNLPTSYKFTAGQVPGYSHLLDYLSPYELSVKPKVSFKLPGVDVDFGYQGTFSRDHVQNIIYLDFRWMF